MAQVGASIFYRGNSGSYRVRFVVDKVALGQVYLQGVWLCPVCIITPHSYGIHLPQTPHNYSTWLFHSVKHFCSIIINICRSQCPRGLRRRSSASRLLRSWVRIPLGEWMFVCCQVEVSATDWSLVQRSPTDCGASLCVIKKPRKRGGWSQLLGCGKYNQNGL